ncbi:MAG: helix-turn-helix domain-containing protein [Candidatus Coproplasma sp.]
MQYGKFFKDARRNCGLSQKQVAEKLDIHQSNISDWENDVSRPEYEKLIELADIYGVTLYELLGLQDPFFRH